MDKIYALQLGKKDWREIYTLPEMVEFDYRKELKRKPKRLYDLVFLDRTPMEREIDFLHSATRAYTLFVTEQTELPGRAAWYYHCKKGRRIAREGIQEFLLQETKNYFSSPYGEKIEMYHVAVAQGFRGIVKWNGNYSVCLKGNFGKELNQVLYWRNNIPLLHGQCLEFWLEYRKTGSVSISMNITLLVRGNTSGEVYQKWEFSEEEIEQGIQIDNQMSDGVLFVSLLAKGKGEIRMIGLHDRHSRRGHGLFLPGGERYITSNREEVFCYFDPGDMKPPLNVYFSGYKTIEGFEGYYLMRKMGCPFLLVAEARLEGGGFYMGVPEYEALIPELILKYMRELGFTADQVILSGISMGSCGALYYGCDIRPHAVIVGKPLVSIGDVAANERLNRPGGFPTSLDVLGYLCDDANEDSVVKLNRRFWDKFDGTEWGQTKIIVSYMIEDDYDRTAYQSLISHLHSEGVQLYGKGLHGRHNDNSGGIVSWFSGQLKQTLSEDFQRKVDT